MRSTALKDISRLLSGHVIAKLFGLAALMLFARTLSKEEMAVFPAFLMLAGLINIVLTFGIFSTFMRDIPALLQDGNLARARSLIVTGSLVVIAGTIPPAIAAYFWSDAISQFVYKTPEKSWIIEIMVPGFVAFVIAKIVEFTMWGAGRFAATSKIQVLEAAARPALTLTLYVFLGFKGVVIGLVIAQYVVAAAGLYSIRDLLMGPSSGLYPLGQLLKEAMPYYAGNYLSYLRGDGDTILISIFLGPAVLAEYYVAKILYSNLMLVFTSVDKVAVERLARFARTPEFSTRISRLYAELTEAIIPFVLLIIAITPFAMTILAGPQYGNAVWPAILLLLAALAQFVALPVERAIFIAVPGTVRVTYAFFEVLVVLAGALLLIPVAGLMGVVLARIASPILGFLAGLLILHGRINLRLDHSPALLALATALPGSVMAILLTGDMSGTFLQAIAGAAITGICWCALFAALTWLVNRQLLEKGWLAARRFRKGGQAS